VAGVQGVRGVAAVGKPGGVRVHLEREPEAQRVERVAVERERAAMSSSVPGLPAVDVSCAAIETSVPVTAAIVNAAARRNSLARIIVPSREIAA
jgi:hypothetical protein